MSAVLDAGGELLSQQRYMPFGSERPITGGVTQTDFGFTGQRDLAAAGLMDYNARWYGATVGAFTQPDSIVPDFGNPQSLNRFSYAYNNPINYIDPTGHDPWWCGDDTGCVADYYDLPDSEPDTFWTPNDRDDNDVDSAVEDLGTETVDNITIYTQPNCVVWGYTACSADGLQGYHFIVGYDGSWIPVADLFILKGGVAVFLIVSIITRNPIPVVSMAYADHMGGTFLSMLDPNRAGEFIAANQAVGNDLGSVLAGIAVGTALDLEEITQGLYYTSSPSPGRIPQRQPLPISPIPRATPLP